MRRVLRLLALSMLACFHAADGQINRNVSLFGRSTPEPLRYSGCWAYVAPDSSEYGLVGAYTGTYIIALDDSANLRQAGYIAGPQSNWREITVLGNHAFVVSEGGGALAGMQVISLAPLPDSVRLVTTYRSTFTTGHIIMRDISSDSAYVYVSGASGTGGVHILDVSNPAAPAQVGLYDPAYYIHDAHIRGNRMYASAGGQRKIDIVDISDKTNPILLRSIPYPGSYTHSCWTTEDHKYLFLTDEQDGQVARIYNIENLNNIFEVAQYSANLQSLVHNPYILGRYTFIAHNTEGLRVVDINDPTVPVEVGHYDTFTGPSGGFNGLWSACPYLPSGKILGGDRVGGLYIWKFNNTRAIRIYGTVRDMLSSPIPLAQISIVETGKSSFADSSGKFKIGAERPTASNPFSLTLRATAQGYLPESTLVMIGQQDSAFANFILRASSTGVDDNIAAATHISLRQNYPNPFNPATELSFTITRPSLVTLKIYDLHGRETTTLVNEQLRAGQHKRAFDASGLSSGVYFYRLHVDGFSETRKMVLMK